MGGSQPTKQVQPQQQPKTLPAPPQQWQQPQSQPPQQKTGGPSQGKQQPKGGKPMTGPPQTVERNRTQGPSQHQQKSMPIEQLPRSVPRAGSSQSISSVSSSSTGVGAQGGGGAIPKASKPEKSIAGKSPRTFRPITKAPGTLGKPLGNIETNFLQLDLSKLVESVYKYDVEITIERGPRTKFNLAAFIEFCRIYLPNERGISYDWRQIALTARPLNIKGEELSGEVRITHPNTGKSLDYRVTIRPAADGAMVPIKNALAK